jgi:hypothetical protein
VGDLSKIPKNSKVRCLWLIDEALAPQGTRWVGVKKRYTRYVWKLDLLIFFNVRINGFCNSLEQLNLYIFRALDLLNL